MAKQVETAAAEVPVARRLFVRLPRSFKGKKLAAGQEFDLAYVKCSQAEADEWLRKGLLTTGAELAASVQFVESRPSDLPAT